MNEKISMRDLEGASGFITMQLLHLTHMADMDTGARKVILRNLETIDWLIQAELNNRINTKKH